VANAPTLDDLRGKMVLLDFWTLGCINCQHIIPDLARLEEEFADSLVVIGVHSGKYEAEHDNESIREAIERFGLKHPVVNDPDFVFWNTYGARAWPTVALIDPAGNVVGGHSGEGIYPLFQPILAALELEFEGRIDPDPFPLALQQSVASTVLSYPAALVADEGRDRLYVADSGHNRILEATLDGALLRVFGSGEQGFADGGANEAQFYDPQGLELSADGRLLYVADTRNHALRAIDLDSGAVETLAGTGRRLLALPQEGADPRVVDMASPWGLLRIDDTLYIGMAGVHQLWTYDLRSETIAVFAGTSREGIDDGLRLSEATLAQPSGITTDGQYLYWVDPESSSIRRVMVGGEIVDTLVGTGLFDWGDADGGPGMGQVQHAQGVVFLDGLLYVADTYNNKLKALNPVSIQLRTVAGSGAGEWRDGAGREAEFDEPSGLAVAGGTILVADTNNHAIRRYDPRTGEVETLQLSNLAVAAGTVGAGVVRVDLPEQVVAPGASNLRVRFSTPEGYHLNSLAPSELRLSAANGRVVALGESDLSWETDERVVEIPVPVQLGEGETTVTAVGTAYFCGDGQEALCLIQRLEFVIPVVVRPGATQGELVLEYELGAEEAAGS
jgi:sugar lactone lactonase YvrE